MTIKCGHHPGTHDTVQEVKMCAQMHHESGGQPLTVPAPAHLKGTGLHEAVEAHVAGEGDWRQAYDDLSTSACLDEIPIRKAKAAPPKEVGYEITEGMWCIYEDGSMDVARAQIFKVQKAVHGSGRLYAKKLVQEEGYAWRFIYEPGANHMRQLKDRGEPMALEEAKEFGALYGVCCVCGRTLTDETSIENGIGPVCAGRFS